MEIARIDVGRTTATCTRRGRIPAGIVGASVQVTFTDPVWNNLIKTVVFRGKETRIAKFDGTVAVIPHEVVASASVSLYFGIFGHDPETDLQIPLIEVRLGITEAATNVNADPGTDPTLPIWAQLQQEVEKLKQGGGGPGTPGKPGDDGGYYTPAVSQMDEDTIEFAFTPSKADMPAVEPVTVELPVGQGSGGIVSVGATEPIIQMEANKEYVCSELVTNLTVSGFSPGNAGTQVLYAVMFKSGDTITVTLPDTVVWAADEPSFSAGKRYYMAFIPMYDCYLGVCSEVG